MAKPSQCKHVVRKHSLLPGKEDYCIYKCPILMTSVVRFNASIFSQVLMRAFLSLLMVLMSTAVSSGAYGKEPENSQADIMALIDRMSDELCNELKSGGMYPRQKSVLKSSDKFRMTTRIMGLTGSDYSQSSKITDMILDESSKKCSFSLMQE